jgi:hypothetical protein
MFSTGNNSDTYVCDEVMGEDYSLPVTNQQVSNDELQMENEYLKERINNAIRCYRNLKDDYNRLVERYNLQAKALCCVQQKYADIMNTAPFNNGFLEYCK